MTTSNILYTDDKKSTISFAGFRNGVLTTQELFGYKSVTDVPGYTAPQLKEAGFSVFPLLAGKKFPAITKDLRPELDPANPLDFWIPGKWLTEQDMPEGRTEWYNINATDNKEKVRKTKMKCDPEYNVGIRTGHQFGIIVVDCDYKLEPKIVDGQGALNNKYSAAELAEILPPTFMVQGASSTHSSHRYYKCSVSMKTINDGRWVKGVDIKADGGYVVAPGSMNKEGKQYTIIDGREPVEISPKLLEILAAFQPKEKAKTTGNEKKTYETMSVEQAMEYLRRSSKHGETIGSGERHARLLSASRAICNYIEDPNDRETALRSYAAEMGVDDREPEDLDRLVSDLVAMPFEGRTYLPPKASTGAEWEMKLIRTEAGFLESTELNSLLILQNAPEIDLSYEQFSGTIYFDPTNTGSTMFADKGRHKWNDDDAVALSAYLKESWDYKRPSHILAGEIRLSAKLRKSYNVMREFMTRETWDGKDRLETWLIDAAGIPDTEYTRLVSKWFLMGAAARVFHPGCKLDYVLVLLGGQGYRKSSLMECLLPSNDYVHGNLQDFSIESLKQLQGIVFAEISEMAAMGKQDMAAIKAAITVRNDKYRNSYGRVVEDHPRSCVFFGTSNDEHFNDDKTGGRRWWPVLVNYTDLEMVREMAAQLWAEAVHRVRAEERYWPSDSEQIAIFNPAQQAVEFDDSDEQDAEEWLKGKNEFKFIDLLVHFSSEKKDRKTWTRKLHPILQKLGWRKESGSHSWYRVKPVKPVKEPELKVQSSYDTLLN